MIDMRTMIVSYITTNLVCASVMALLWLQNRKRFAGIGFWLGLYVAICTGFILFALRGVVSDFLSIVIANVLIVYGILLLYIGLVRFVGKAGSQIHNYIVLAIFMLVHAYFTYLQPSLLARNVNVSVGMFIFAIQIAWFIFRQPSPDTSFNLRSLGVIAVCLCLVSLARVVTDLSIDPGTDFLKANSDAIVILFYQALQIANALSLFLLVNRRLVVDLESDIIERKRAEAAARAGEALYHQMFAAHSAIKLLIEPETGSIVEANLAAVNFYGYPAAVLHHMNIEQINVLTHPEVATLRQEVKAGSLSYFSVPHRLASGQVREVEVNSAPIEVNGHTLLYSIIHDITERKQAEEALKESRRIAEDTFEFTPDALLTVDETGQITRVNQQTQIMFGYTREELLHQKVELLIPQRLRSKHERYLAGFFAAPHRRLMGNRLDLFAASKDGREFPVDVLLSPLQLGGKTYVTAVVRDITERKQAEEALRESEARYRAVSQSASDAIISADSQGRIIGWNRSAEVIFGYAEAEILDQPLTRLMPAHFHAEHLAGMARVHGNGEKHIIGKTVEILGLRKDGGEFPLEVSLSEWQVDSSQFYTAIIRDITRRKQASEALRHIQRQVVEQQRQLAMLEERERVARELHDGLGQVLGYVNVQAQAAQTLLWKNQLEAVQTNLEGLVQVAQDAHANLRHTILGLRDSVSSPQRNLCQALQAYLESFRQAWGIKTSFSSPPNDLPVLPTAVEDQILHIVQEALVNIRKHAGAGRVDVLITLRPGELTLIISDDGHGFDVQLAPDARQEHFGLSIMRERAEQVGGRLEIRSVIGRGTQVLVSIPCLLVPASGDNPTDVYCLRILLVDDQPLFLEGMRNLLKARGLTVIGTAHDGLDAIEQVTALRPDVVLMDVHMPKCDGIEATRRIKTDYPETHVVLLTVSEEDEHLLDAVKYGASSYLLKNLDADRLFATLDGLARGEIQIAPELVARLLAEFNRAGTVVQTEAAGEDAIPADLTMRQWEVLRLVARGLTYKEAGHELHVTEQAVKYHMAQILDRLQLKNREQAVAYLRQVEAARKQKRTAP